MISYAHSAEMTRGSAIKAQGGAITVNANVNINSERVSFTSSPVHFRCTFDPVFARDSRRCSRVKFTRHINCPVAIRSDICTTNVRGRAK
jgi:hypothetical protein